MSPGGIDKNFLMAQGFCAFSWIERAPLHSLRRLVEESFPTPPQHWHERPISMEDHLRQVEQVTLAVGKSGLVEQLVSSHRALFEAVLGDEIDIQSNPYVRVSRPNAECDFIDWHRDTFYGNAPQELNLWFPVVPLAPGAGLTLVPGSHLEPSENVTDLVDPDPFRRTVERGSIAHRMGYLYAPKTDDTISRLRPDRVLLLAPKWGDAVLFFASAVHRATNASAETRITVDVRLKSHHLETSTKSGYYRPLPSAKPSAPRVGA